MDFPDQINKTSFLKCETAIFFWIFHPRNQILYSSVYRPVWVSLCNVWCHSIFSFGKWILRWLLQGVTNLIVAYDITKSHFMGTLGSWKKYFRSPIKAILFWNEKMWRIHYTLQKNMKRESRVHLGPIVTSEKYILKILEESSSAPYCSSHTKWLQMVEKDLKNLANPDKIKQGHSESF